MKQANAPRIGCVPPMKGYEPVTSLPVDVDGISFDVLRYDPEGARALMTKAGFPSRSGKRMTIDLTFEGSPVVTEILQQQWRTNLNIEVKLQRLEFVVWIRTTLDLSYRGVIEGGWTGKYTDPATFLDLFQNGSVQSGTGWSDPKFDALLPWPIVAESRQSACNVSPNVKGCLLAAMPLSRVLSGLLLTCKALCARMGFQSAQ